MRSKDRKRVRVAQTPPNQRSSIVEAPRGLTGQYEDAILIIAECYAFLTSLRACPVGMVREGLNLTLKIERFLSALHDRQQR